MTKETTSHPVLGAMPSADVAAWLRDIGDDETAAEIDLLIEDVEVSFSASDRLADAPESLRRVWRHTEHAFGFIESSPASGEPLSIVDARNIEPDAGLKNTSLKLTLDRLRVADYPGSGEHNVLVEFTGRHRVEGTDIKEGLKFAQTYRVRGGQGAGMAGYPVFIGLRAPGEGIALEIKTINVSNTNDEALIAAFESDTVKGGLELIASPNPVVGMLTDVATGIVGAILKRNRNKPVQDVFLGLDFSTAVTRPKLREGTYLAVQIPDTMAASWDWSQWVYDRSKGRITRSDSAEMIPFNYLAFSVSRMS